MRDIWVPMFASLLVSSPTYAIVGGEDVEIEEQLLGSNFSFIASVRASTFAEDHSCGATIVGKRWVMTAAHCLVASSASLEDSSENADVFTQYDVVKPKEISITVGNYDLSNDTHDYDLAAVEFSNIYKVTHVVIHPDYYPEYSEKTVTVDNSDTTDTTDTTDTGEETEITVLESTAYQNDIALLYVERDFPDHYVRVKLGDLGSDNRLSNLEGEWDSAAPKPNLKVAGWGSGEEEAEEVTAEQEELIEETDSIHYPMKETDVSYFPTPLCYERLESVEDLPRYIESPLDLKKLCTLPTEIVDSSDSKIIGNGACEGDTGGPLLLRNEDGITFTQIGIISAGPIINSVCSSVTLPTWYTNVSYYKEWIDSYITSEQSPEAVITKPTFLIETDVVEEDTTTEGEVSDSTTEEDLVTDVEQCENNNGQYVTFSCDEDGGSLGYIQLLWLLLLLAVTRIKHLRR